MLIEGLYMPKLAKRGIFRSAVDALIAARERQAARYINSLLLSLDDES